MLLIRQQVIDLFMLLDDLNQVLWTVPMTVTHLLPIDIHRLTQPIDLHRYAHATLHAGTYIDTHTHTHTEEHMQTHKHTYTQV